MCRGRGQLKCDGTRAENRFRLSAKRTRFKSAGASVQSTTGSQGVRISGSNAGYTVFRSSVKGTGYPLHSPVSLSLPFPCVTVCRLISNAVYNSTLLLCQSWQVNVMTFISSACAVQASAFPQPFEKLLSSRPKQVLKPKHHASFKYCFSISSSMMLKFKFQQLSRREWLLFY